MKYIKKIFICFLVSFFLFPCLWAKSGGSTAAEFLKFSVGARASSMGEAFTGLADDSSAIYWNVAGLTSIPGTEVSATYNTWIEGISIGNVCCSIPFSKKSSIGVGITYLNSGSIDRTWNDKSVHEAYTAVDTGITLGYGIKFDKDLSLGCAVKYISETIDTESGTGFAADLGGLYSIKIGIMPVTLGVVASNFGTKMGPGEKSDLPSAVRAGASVKLVKNVVNVSAEFDSYQKSDSVAGIGAEFLVSDIFTLRLGYKLLRDDLSGIEPLTAGFGIMYSEKYDFMLDYAFDNMGVLGSAHKVSIGIRL